MIVEWFQLELAEWIAISVMLVMFFIQLWYYFYYYRSVIKQAREQRNSTLPENTEQPPVSVIICAHDQADKLEDNLPLFLKQIYPEYQIVVVNDASTDNTEDVLTRLEQRYDNLYHTFVPAGVLSASAKKMAVTIGIKAAKYEHLLFTEPDCIPASDRWIESMVSSVDDSCGIVLGYSSFTSVKGFMKNFVIYDTLFTSLQFMGFAKSGHPFMGFGSNLAYKKELFFKNKGFASHLILKSGDDDLFIGEIANANNTRIEISPESKILISRPNLWHFWKDQKLSHFPTSACYKKGIKFRLSLEMTTRVLFYCLFLLSLIYGSCTGNLLMVLSSSALFVIRCTIQLIIVNKSARLLDERRFYVNLPFYDFITPIIRFYLWINHFAHRSSAYTWQTLR